MSSQRTVGVGQTPQIGFARRTKEGNQALLSRGALRRRQLGEQFFLKALATDHLPTLPAANVRNDFLVVINGDRRRVGFDGELAVISGRLSEVRRMEQLITTQGPDPAGWLPAFMSGR